MIKIFSSKTTTITSAAIILGLTSFVSRFIGIIRDRILAHNFGTGDVLDAYYAAFKIPDLLYVLLISGALSVGLIPIFTKVYYQKKDNKKDAWELISNIINISGIIIVPLSFLLIIFTPQLIPLIAPGFTDEKLKLTIQMTRIMFLSPLFLGMSAIVGGVLQSLKNFFIYSLSPIFYNFGIIFGATILVPVIGNIGLAWGVIIGSILHLAIQLPVFFKTGFRYSKILNFKDKNIIQIGKLMIPRVMALSALQINLIITTAIASTLTAGSITIFNYANNLQSFPIGMIGVSFAVAAFPTLSLLANQKNKKDFVKNLSSTVRQILFFIIPLTIIFLLLRAQIVRIVLGTGQFGWEATIKTADSLAYFSLSLFAQSLLALLIRAYYAWEDTKTPFFISIIAVTFNIILNIIFTKTNINMGVAGLALTYSLAYILNFTLLWVFLKFKIGHLDEKRIFIAICKFSIAGLFMSLAVQISKYLLASIVDMHTFWGIFIQGIVAGLLGCFVYIIIGLILKTHEMKIFIKIIKDKLIKTKNLPSDISEINEI